MRFEFNLGVLSLFILLIFAYAFPKFGKFELFVDNLQMCKGPKRKDCTKWDMRIENRRMMIFNLTAFQNIAPLKVKVVVSRNGKELVRLQMSRVCDNLFMKPLFASMFNSTSKCVIPKGNYYQELDMQETFAQYYGGEFLYGSIMIRSVINNDECNFSCCFMNITFSPK